MIAQRVTGPAASLAAQNKSKNVRRGSFVVSLSHKIPLLMAGIYPE